MVNGMGDGMGDRRWVMINEMGLVMDDGNGDGRWDG